MNDRILHKNKDHEDKIVEQNSHKLKCLNQEIMDLKDKLNELIAIESNKLIDQDILTASTNLDRLIVEYTNHMITNIK